MDLLMISATVLAAVSFLLNVVIRVRSLILEIAIGYIPLLIGCVCLRLCYMAYKRAERRPLVLWWSIALTPFAFSYPAWAVILGFLRATGLYAVPMR
jgi:hypothetical protein